MTKTIMNNEYREHGEMKTLVLTIEEEMSEPEVSQQIANLYYQYASVKSQLIANPNNADLASQIDKINNDISVYTNFLNGFSE